MSAGADDAILAARLCAIDPGLGGIVLRGDGDGVIAALRAALPNGAPFRRLPPAIDDDSLLGGLDLGATLARGTPVRQAGLLARVDGGALVVPMAERLGARTAARIAGVLDTGDIEGVASRFVVVAIDEGVDGEAVPAALMERLAFRFSIAATPDASPAKGGTRNCEPRDGAAANRSNAPSIDPIKRVEVEPELHFRPEGGQSGPAQDRAPRQSGSGLDLGAAPTLVERPAVAEAMLPAPQPLLGRYDNEVVDAIATAAFAFGVDSPRASLFALRAARAASSLDGRGHVTGADLMLAVRLVLVPRATRVPAPPEEATAEQPPPNADREAGDEERGTPETLADTVLAATLASLPPDMLAALAAGAGRKAARSHGAGERRKSAQRGRPLGSRAGLPRGGARLSLIDTLRAAAPWQGVRGRETRVRIRRDDLRIRRFETRAESVTIFAVDASGSAAAARLAEAKGAVELLLAQAYVKRAQVALLAFRGMGAAVLLPPTRSLTRARRALAELPGGGGTPLAAGLTAAHGLADGARAKGRTPFIVVLTDGRANIAADGSAVRATAERDAEDAARAIGQAGIGAAFIDTSARPRPEGARLALAMAARYLPLPRADAAAMQRAIAAAQPA